jgi:hypothetical protein
LRDWLGNAFEEGKAVVQSGVPQIPSATIPQPVQTAASAAVRGKADSGLARFRAEPGNRRNQLRKPCRLGAEVFKSGTSVPNRCSLSDISVGGCYVEMPTPFPPGIQVEIQIRTRNTKLRIAGEVQSTHPGFGMGVRFEPLSSELQGQVLDLLRELGQSTQGLEMGSLPWQD